MLDTGGSEALERLRERCAAELELAELRGRFDSPYELADATRALAATADVEPSTASDRELLDAATALERLRRLIDAAELAVLAEVDARDLTDADQGLRTRSWLALTAQLPGGIARRRVRLARSLASLPGSVRAALADGDLSEHHVGVLADAAANPRIQDALAPRVDDLVAAARTMPFDPWRQHVRALVAQLDVDGAEPTDPGPDDSVTLTQGFEGRWTLRGDFDTATGQVIRNVLDATADRLHRQHRSDAEHAPDLHPPARRHLLADALVELARAHLAGDTPATSRRAPAAEVLLHLDAADPSRLVDGTGFPIGDTDHLTLACDPILRCVVFDMRRNVLDLGHEQRLATPAQRLALAQRDGGCTFPGCDAPPSWCDVHHVRHWLDGGATDLPNLVLLCRHHHGVTHRAGWTMTIDDDQWCRWRTPNGHTFWSQRHQQPRAGPTRCR